MNSSGYYGRNGGYSRTSPPGRRQGGADCPDSGAPGTRESFTRKKIRDYGRRPLRQRRPQHYPAHTRTHEQRPWHERSATAVLVQDEIRIAFGHLKTHPQRALDTAEVLLDRHSSQQPSLFIQVVLLKARALFNLNKMDDCIAFIDSLGTRMRSERNLLLAKARALQAKGCFNEALPFFQYLYANYRTTDKDHKTYSLSLARNLQYLGDSDNMEKALAIFTRLRTRAAGGQDTPCNDKDIEMSLGRHLQLMGGADNLQKALAIYTRLRTQTAGKTNTPCNDKEIELTLGRHLQIMGGAANMERALAIFTRLRTLAAAGRANTPCNNKDIELSLGRHLQLMGGADNLEQALAVFTRLRTNHAAGKVNTPCNDKEIELALGRLLQLMGGKDNLQQALAIFTRLRTNHAAGKVNTPCNDKEIELALGRLLQLMGGKDNLQQALAIFTRLHNQAAAGSTTTLSNNKEVELSLARHLQLTGGADNLEKALAIVTRLRIRAAAGRVNAPCDDKDIELSLGRLLELKGGKQNLEKALAIYTRLRARAVGGQENTPCDDKDMELALGVVLAKRGGPDNLEKALAILTRLRTRAAGGKANIPCNDKQIELALATLYIAGENWPEFDALLLEARRFPGFEPHVCLSVRYLRELLGTKSVFPAHSRLLGKAICSAVRAMEESGFMHASCLSQLAHCIRLLSCWPDALLQQQGIQRKDVKRLNLAAKFLFNTAETISPRRQWMEKDQDWRTRERALLALLS